MTGPAGLGLHCLLGLWGRMRFGGGALYVPRPVAMGEAPSPGILRVVPGPQVERHEPSNTGRW